MIAKKRAGEERLPTGPFKGFPPEARQFFRDLADNQNKEWMAEHKADYERYVHQPMQALVTDLSEALEKAGIPLRGDPQRSIFRINRDIRFSKDKRPYKTNASAALTRSGGKQAPGVLYFHLDPNGSFAAAGFFQPEPDVLHTLRLAIMEKPDKWGEIEVSLLAQGYGLMRDDMLVRHPKGFEDAPPAIADELKLKSWVVKSNLPSSAIAGPGLIEDLTGLAAAAAPLMQFGWSALDRHPAPAASRSRS